MGIFMMRNKMEFSVFIKVKPIYKLCLKNLGEVLKQILHEVKFLYKFPGNIRYSGEISKFLITLRQL